MAKRTEPDTQADPHRADTRTAGGVGRMTGDDAGYSEETGAERRSEGRRQMGARLKSERVALMVANTGVEHSELTKPWAAVEAAGGAPALIAPEKSTVQTVHADTDEAAELEAEMTTEDARPDDFDALVLPGGVANPDKLRMDEAAVSFTREFATAGKPIAAICHGPWTLVEADVVRGKTVSSWPSLRTDLRNAGADWRDVEVFTCRARGFPLVTSRKPDDLEAFEAAAVAAFAG